MTMPHRSAALKSVSIAVCHSGDLWNRASSSATYSPASRGVTSLQHDRIVERCQPIS
jgi:hypothetical protein